MPKVEICPADVVEAEEVVRAELDSGSAVGLTRDSRGDIFAFPDQCPHRAGLLSDGWVEDDRVICSVHFAEFDLSTGQAHQAPSDCPNLTFYPVHEVDGMVYVELPEGEGVDQ
ncbi:Rieske (2Fe-2S) protein [Haloglycomyces albus]|uniref:Rieske (2Fe-2S) protein n=1 Tax=Haloglycomyces albus TaxID=526067 RepID=UPI00046CE23A|nr:Rieske (2Fe-2S) protein [Haloglycomyces albus]